MDIKNIKTLGELRNSAYVSKTIKEEIKDNLIERLKQKQPIFEGIIGYENTVIPEVERAILSQHNILFLGLRGQAKTRMARLMVQLLDEYIPYISDTDLKEDPFNPISDDAIEMIEQHGEGTQISWWHRSERYVEKLATPDVSIADLIGDIDPIKAATLKLPYSDPKVIHYGLIPRAHRSIFVINELPDLQARIQVSLFNILQEGDIQIRGFKMALPLDVFFVFSANPEDYTNRGSIITPLKDRIESQILTHYPENISEALQITEQEAKISSSIKDSVMMLDLLKVIIEKVGFEARYSEFVDEHSGVSARLSISALENLYSASYRRALLNNEKNTIARISDLMGIVPSITGKVELDYEGEQVGAYDVAQNFINQGIKSLFLDIYPNPEKKLRDDEKDPYRVIKEYFAAGNKIELMHDSSDIEYRAALDSISGLRKLAEEYEKYQSETYVLMELALHGLSSFEIISKEHISNGYFFNDPFTDMWNDLNE